MSAALQGAAAGRGPAESAGNRLEAGESQAGCGPDVGVLLQWQNALEAREEKVRKLHKS